jgi:hypothetical protein
MQPVTPPAFIQEPAEPGKQSWLQKLGKLLFILICFEVGVFLLIFPWMEYWDRNSIASLSPWMRDVWDSAYFRGGLSGLGLVNLYISLVEVFRLRRPRPGRLRVSAL